MPFVNIKRITAAEFRASADFPARFFVRPLIDAARAAVRLLRGLAYGLGV